MSVRSPNISLTSSLPLLDGPSLFDTEPQLDAEVDTTVQPDAALDFEPIEDNLGLEPLKDQMGLQIVVPGLYISKVDQCKESPFEAKGRKYHATRGSPLLL